VNEQSIFIAAMEREAPAREAFLDEACAGNAALRERVEKLLASHEQAVHFMEQPAGRLAPTSNQPPPARPGTHIGPYKLREQIGEGGFGVVYVAEQEKPVRRKVALKIIKPGMDTKDVIARFEAERQALALMDHPNVARVLDAGSTDSGRPYFVMELVQGVTITEFCDKNNLSTRERLGLFADVCRAVQHAHQKGIIHRDLKPSNIMVTLHDGQPVAKVIDFGVSKALSQQLTEKSIYTAYGQMIGTPSYMSPEQAEMSGLGIDTRSDIYSLGVLLYELLTGKTPLDAKRLRESGYAEMLRIIREEEPQRPSLKISTLGAEATVIAQHRHTDPQHLRRELRGELDWIVMKCLEKDRSRRYETAIGLARDIERYLHDEPVEACPPSAVYRFGKFARRNKGPVLAASLVLFALIGGILATTWQAVRATRAEAQALAESNEKERARQEAVANANKAIAAAEQERKAKDLAQRRLTQIEKANDILGSIFLDLDPRWEEQGKPLRAQLGERLEQAAAQLDAEAVGDPLAVARLQHTLATSQMALGHASKAVGVLEKARQTREALLGPDHEETLQSMQTLAMAYQFNGRLDTALPMLGQVWTKQKEKLGPEHRDTLKSSFHLGMLYLSVGRRDEGLSLLESALPKLQEKFGPDHRFTLFTTSQLANVYANTRQFDKAIPLLEQTLATQKEKVGPDHVGTILTMNNLALAYRAVGQRDKAVQLLEEALAKWKMKLGAHDPGTRNAVRNLASTYRMNGQLDKALILLEEALVEFRAKLGPDHPETLGTLDSLALAFRDHGDYSRAETLFLEALALKKQKLAADDPSVTHTMASLGWNYIRQKRYAEAETLLRECLAIRAKRDSDKWQYFETHRGIGASLLGQKRYAEAEPYLVRGYEGLKQREASMGADTRFLTEGLEQIVELYDAWGKPDEAAKWRLALDEHNAVNKRAPDSAENP
jgi:serine/threonine protein kinase/tetratricopeptide (TPR) repeat protein